MDGGGDFGAWGTDEHGLPCFDLDPRAGRRPLVLPDGDARGVWHQVGNDRITATAHAGGWTTVYACDRGFLRLSDTDPSQPQRLGGQWALLGRDGAERLSSRTPPATTRWGAGYAAWRYAHGGIELQRRVWAPFGDVPALRVDVQVRGTGLASYEERWGLDLYPLALGFLMSRWTPPPASHTPFERSAWRVMLAASSTMRAVTERLRRYLGARTALHVRSRPDLHALVLVPTYRGIGKSVPTDRPAWIDAHPKPLFLAALSDHPSDAWFAGNVATLRCQLRSDADSATLAFGCSPLDELPDLLARLRAAAPDATAAAWRAQLRLEMPAAPWLEREAPWHAYYVRSSQVRDDYFEATILPQGSAYGFVHGLQGAVRDYALTVVPLTFLDPAGARDNLRLMMRMTKPDGMMFYAHTGHGRCTSTGIHHAPTDLPLFLLWALTEHVWATGDVDFLDEVVPFYPKHAGAASTVRERARLAWRYVRDRVRRGAHGLLRVGSGDWSDPIALMVRRSRPFHRDGESGFNTAMAAYVLPRAADLLAASHPADAAEIRAFASELRRAMDAAWTGRWYLRGWDGRGQPIGDRHLFLDCQVWALIAGLGTEEQRRHLVDEIRTLLDEPSPIGATILDRPHPVRFGVLARGWDCNGGVWAAINGLLAWAYALHDPALAWRNLEKQSLAAHARAYPHVWYGIWSGPDAYNAHYADRPGETFLHPATPMTEFPLMNSNVHALPLLALLRVLGVETTPDGIRITPRWRAAPWRLVTPLVSCAWDGGALRAETHTVNGRGGRAQMQVMPRP
jgi:hypothetical protein